MARFAPYFDVTLGTSADLLRAVAGGVKAVNLAFVTAASRTCEPSWGETRRYDDLKVAGLVRTLRAANAEARVSFGGASSRELAEECSTVPALVAAYQKVVDAYDVRLMDLDIEGAALQDRDSVHRRNAALRELQRTAHQRGAPLRVSYTLPAAADGLTPAAQDVLRDAREAGVDLNAVNVMAMNYGGGPRDMSERAIAVAEGTETFLRALWQGREAGAWGMVAVTPMIGTNDSAGQVFRPEDAARLVDFARQHQLAWLSFWSLNRDRPCPSGTPTTTASPICSGVRQRPGDFTSALARYGTGP